MKIDYDVEVEKKECSSRTKEFTRALIEFIDSDRDNMRFSFGDDMHTALQCHRNIYSYLMRNKIFDVSVIRRKTNVYVVRENV